MPSQPSFRKPIGWLWWRRTYPSRGAKTGTDLIQSDPKVCNLFCL